jgi:hypothetical protein
MSIAIIFPSLKRVRFVAFMPSHFNVCFNYDVIYYIGGLDREMWPGVRRVKRLSNCAKRINRRKKIKKGKKKAAPFTHPLRFAFSRTAFCAAFVRGIKVAAETNG